jgi:signal transduction histidine kinase
MRDDNAKGDTASAKKTSEPQSQDQPVKKRGLIAGRSLTGRVLFFASIWTIIAFAGVAIIVSTLYKTRSERAFGDLLRAHLNTVIEAVSFDDQGKLVGNPQLGSLAFSQPGSGWIWIVDPIDIDGNQQGDSINSSSLGLEIIARPTPQQVPYNAQYIRIYPMDDSVGNALLISETEVEYGDEGKAARIRVGGNLNVLEEDVNSFIGRLAISLLVAAIGTLLINMLVILYGLKPLDHVRSSLEKIRNGDADRLSGDFPNEIAPLADEVNALIDSNKRVVERARMQVGNLAHSLKTPIAVMLNEARGLPEAQSELVKNQVGMMQNQVQTYLDRARISAQRGSVLARTDIIPSLERLLRVMNKLNPNIDFSLEIKAETTLIALEGQDFEEVMGNLIENAARFARENVVVTVDDLDKNTLTITVADDGDGLTDDEKTKALKRGARLDESKPGSGLGLSIAGEIAEEYEGKFILLDAEIGGLAAQLQLPKAAS